MVKTAFVLAGGLGLRLREMVGDVPKPLAQVAGVPFLIHLLRYLTSYGVEEVILCVGYKGEIVQAVIGDSFGACRIRYSHESTARGTGGALFLGLERFPPQGQFLVLNGDTFFPIDLELFSRESADGDWVWKLALFAASDLQRYSAVDLDSRSVVTALRHGVKHNDVGANRFLANSGIWLCRFPESLSDLHGGATTYSMEDYLNSFMSLHSGKVRGELFDAAFVDIGVPSDYRKAQTMAELTQNERSHDDSR